MVAILLMTFFKLFFVYLNYYILNQISLQFIVQDPINNIPPLVQIMPWCRTSVIMQVLSAIATQNDPLENIDHDDFKTRICLHADSA